MNKTMAIISIIFLIAYLSLLAYQYDQCDKAGGNYVRGVFWFTCIEKNND